MRRPEVRTVETFGRGFGGVGRPAPSEEGGDGGWGQIWFTRFADVLVHVGEQVRVPTRLNQI
jgi:hypothetical protein